MQVKLKLIFRIKAKSNYIIYSKGRGDDLFSGFHSKFPALYVDGAGGSHRDNLIFICHGGPLAEPEDAQAFLSLCPDCHGFYGAPSMERLPTERAIREQTAAFGQLKRATHPA